MNTQYVDLEVRLLVLKYGYNRVIEALSKAKGVSEHDIQTALLDTEKAKTKKTKARRKSVFEISEKLVQKVPEKAAQLRELAGRFENRTFLPQMKDVRHFLIPFGIDPKSLKSRNDSAPKVFEELSKLPFNELEEFIAHPPSSESTFSELANEIIGDRNRSGASSNKANAADGKKPRG